MDYTQQTCRVRLFIVLIILMLVNFILAMSLVVSRYYVRQEYAALNELAIARNELQETWAQLLLEQSVYANEVQIERFARNELKMIDVPSDQVIAVFK